MSRKNPCSSRRRCRRATSIPQITQAPINYFDFLNFFRGGHTIDDNLGATSIAETLQASLLKAAIKTGHLRKTKNMAMPNESLADIFLTELGVEQLATPQNGQQLMQGKKSEWERVRKEPLGEGGQSKVYLVRTPERTKQRKAQSRNHQFARSYADGHARVHL